MYSYYFIKKLGLFGLMAAICLLASCGESYKHDKAYVDMVVKGDTLWGLTANGYINNFNLKTNAVINANIHTDTAIVHITLDRLGRIIISDKNQKIKLLDPQSLIFTIIDSAVTEIYGMVYDNHNNGFVVTKNGISNFKSKVFYTPDSSFHLNPVLSRWYKPTVIHMDKNNNIWIGINRGEWGGDLLVFNTSKKAFTKLKLNGNIIQPVNSIFENANEVFISSGLLHDNTSGSILKFDHFKADSIFLSKTLYKEHKSIITGEYIGPGLYHIAGSCIYFYSQNGIFKGKPTQNLSEIKRWTLIAKPKLHWSNLPDYHLGTIMNVVQMQFAPNGHLYLATTHDGILAIDSNKVTPIP